VEAVRYSHAQQPAAYEGPVVALLMNFQLFRGGVLDVQENGSALLIAAGTCPRWDSKHTILAVSS